MSEPLTPERAAREWAAESVEIHAADNRLRVAVCGKVFSERYRSVDLAESHAIEMRDAIAAAVRGAIERYERACPLASALSDERLAEIEGLAGGVADAALLDSSILLPEQVHAVHESLDDLLAEVLHLRACLREIVRSGCEPEAYALGMARGEALGAGRQREADVEAARQALAATSGSSHGHHAARGVLRAVSDPPLVADAKEGG